MMVADWVGGHAGRGGRRNGRGKGLWDGARHRVVDRVFGAGGAGGYRRFCVHGTLRRVAAHGAWTLRWLLRRLTTGVPVQILQYVTLVTALLTVSAATAVATAGTITTGVPPLQALDA